MKGKIFEFMKDTNNIDLIAKDIVDIFEEKASNENIDFSYDLAKGSGKIKSRNTNTWFNFDTKKDTALETFKKYLFDDDLVYIEEGSEDEENLTNEVYSYLSEIGRVIEKNYLDSIRVPLRGIVLSDANKDLVPMKNIEVRNISIIDSSVIPEPQKYLLKILKKPEIDINVEKITAYVQDKQIETGKTVSEIYDTEKDSNELFKNVLGLEQGKKYLFDGSLDMFVDYSFSEEVGDYYNKFKK